MDGNKSWSSGFEFVDIEIIDHSKQTEATVEKWNCDQCSLFFLSKQKLNEHKKKHVTTQEIVKCQYCNKTLSDTEESKECYSNKKCETCEYRCSKCPQRFLRHSSLLNHENNHVLLKKKKSVLTRPIKKDINGIKPTNGLNAKVTKKKSVKKQPIKQSNIKNMSLRKKQNVQSEESPLEESDDDKDEFLVSHSKKPKQSLKRNKAEETSVTVNKTPTTIMSNVSPLSSTSTPLVSNTVNYKPFSCHVCGDTFASDNALLEHIKSHGENAGKGFKCKHCGDEFDDIYKMQYHLAICPLAEDELETSLMQNIPVKFQTKPIPVSGGTGRKRGRRKKMYDIKSEETSTIIDRPDLTPSLGTRGSRRKRKMEEEEEVVNKTPKVTNSSLPKRTSKSRTCATEIKFYDESADNGIELAVNDFPEDFPIEDPLETSNANENEEDDRKKVHACPFPRCGIKFTREKALLCHMRNHNDDFDDALKCHKCDIPFDDLQSLRTHIDICKGIKEEKDDDFEQPPYVDSHDSGDRPFYTFQRNKGQFLCKICGRAYISQEKLDSHSCQGCNPLSMKFPCRICGEDLTHLAYLKDHFKQYHPSNLQFQCPTCLEEFDDLMETNDHMLKHLRDKFECAVCLEKMESKSDLQKHYIHHHSGVDRSICLICNKRYSDPSGLAKHRFVHTGERPYACPLCYMTFTLKSSQVIHLRRHINYRPYECHLCPKTFFNSGDLKKHSRSHTGERPYKCKVCKAAFHLKESLNSHSRTHLRIRPFKCSECPKAFNSKSFLRYHMPIHTGIRPYKCPVCPESYFQLGSLRTHINKHHIDKFASDMTCSVCGVEKETPKMVHHLIVHVKNQSRSLMIKWDPAQPQNLEPIKKGGCSKKKQTALKANIGIKKRGQRASRTTTKNPSSSQHDQSMFESEANLCDEAIFDCVDIKVEEDSDSGVQEVTAFEPTTKDEFVCLLCAEVFTSHESLLEHVYIHI